MSSKGGWSSEVVRRGSSLRLTLGGDADMETTDRLRAVLAEVHSRALSEPTEEVVADLSQLAFMNSTCLKAVITWLGAVEALEPAARYRIRVLSNRAIPWQRRSLQALVSFAPGLLSLELI